MLNNFLVKNKLTRICSLANERRVRRKERPIWMSDNGDPFFFFKTEEYINSIPYKYADKLVVKKMIDIDGIKISKVLFEWNKKGEIISGDLPQRGKVVLKANNGSGYIKIVDSGDIQKKLLKRLYKKWVPGAKKYGYLNGESHYLKIDTRVFAEEYLGENISEYSFHISDAGVIFRKVKIFIDHSQDAIVDEYDVNFNPIYSSKWGEMSNPISDVEKEWFSKILPYAEKIQKELKRYARIDFSIVNNKIFFGEITFTSGNGTFYTKKTGEDGIDDVKMMMKIIKGK